MAEEKQDKTANIDQNKQEKLKAKTEAEEKDSEIKTESPEKLRSMLSNKNSDYVFRLQKELIIQGKISSDKAAEEVNKLLPEIVVAQRHGQPANGLYMASPKIKAQEMLHPKQEAEIDHPFWQRAVDGALLYMVFFIGIFGVIALFTPNTKDNGQMGIVTLASTGALMGIFMTKYNDWIMPVAGKRKKLPFGRMILGIIGLLAILMVWIWLFNLPGLRTINVVLPGGIDLVIAAVIFGIRYLFRKQYNITGSIFAPTPRRK
ncbi:DUF1129 family protein [Lactobacillus sp. PSON]|uniref:DUF1129 family protein n=1 Tax=Lactobacillus sp. PSON TaxID=3455454 RepID=UPI0040424E6C